MIIDHDHRIVFIHIPKCAGTTVRRFLQPYDSYKGLFTSNVGKHPDIGMLDYFHIPLFTLKAFFPEQYEAVQQYWSAAVIRDPYDRFASSVSQRINMYGGKKIQDMTEKEIDAEISDCIKYLKSNDVPYKLLPPDYIHFQRQIDYIFLDGKRVVENVYTTNSVDSLVASLVDKIGVANVDSLDGQDVGKKENQVMLYRNDLVRFFVKILRPIARFVFRFFPRKWVDGIRRGVYIERDRKIGNVFGQAYVKDFVKDYYSGDISFYQEIKAAE